MKTLNSFFVKLFMVSVLLISTTQTRAVGDSYSLTTLSQTYTNLASPTVVSTATWDYNAISSTIPVGFSFPIFDQSITSLTLYAGDLTMGPLEDYWINFFSCTELISRGSGLSPVSYELSGTAGNRILKIEFKNAGINLTTEYVNVQAWLYETGVIEYHFGPNTISSTTIGDTYLGVMDFENVEMLLITGSATAPTLDNTFAPMFLSSGPTNGTVYRLTKTTSGVKNAKSIIKLYPNPTQGQVTVNASDINLIEVFNTMGQKVISTTEATFDISAQPAGIYIVKVAAAGVVYTEKIVKK